MSTQLNTPQKAKNIKATNKSKEAIKPINNSMAKTNKKKAAKKVRIVFLNEGITGKKLAEIKGISYENYATAELTLSAHLKNILTHGKAFLNSFSNYNDNTYKLPLILDSLTEEQKYVTKIEKNKDGSTKLDKKGNIVRTFILDKDGNKVKRYFTYKQVQNFVANYYKNLSK
jgi:hypothetical protein